MVLVVLDVLLLLADCLYLLPNGEQLADALTHNLNTLVAGQADVLDFVLQPADVTHDAIDADDQQRQQQTVEHPCPRRLVEGGTTVDGQCLLVVSPNTVAIGGAQVQSEGTSGNVGQGDVIVGNITPTVVHTFDAIGIGDWHILVEVEGRKLNGEAALVG